MIYLRTLGALELTSADNTAVSSVLAQPRRAALLCYLALALPRGFHRRDTLFALFWPEEDAEQARHALRQSVYFLRRALGPKTIISRGDEELALGPEEVTCDVWAFDAAVDDCRPADALALYRGELLAGFHISAAPDFERWLDQERSRLRQRAVESGWALAAAREDSGDASGAIEAARRAASLAPTDETSLRRLILLLMRLGDRAAAVRAYEAFAWRLEEEYELEPSAETRAVIASIRAESGETHNARPGHLSGPASIYSNEDSKVVQQTRPPSSRPGSDPALAREFDSQSSVPTRVDLWKEPADDQRDEADPLVAGLQRAFEAPAVSHSLHSFARRRSAVLVAGAVLLALVGTWHWRGARDQRSPAESSLGGSATERVLVADFDNFTAESLTGEAVAQALRIDLANSRALRVAGPPTVAAALRRMRRPPDSRLDRELAREVAVREGIRGVISGEVRKAGPGYVVSAALVEAATGDVVDGWRETAPDSDRLFQAIDRLSAAVRKRVGKSLPSLAPGESLWHMTTSSLEALRRQAQAAKAMTQGDFLRAANLFDEAIQLDSGFAQAYVGLAHALGNAGAPYSRVVKAQVKAFQFRSILSPPERYAVTANYYGVVGDLPGEIEALRKQVEAAAPNREFVLYASLGGALASAGHLAEAETVLWKARAVFPTAMNQYALVTVLYRRGKAKEAEAVLREMRTRFPEFRELGHLQAQIAAASGDYVGADSLATAAAAENQGDRPRRLLALTAAIRGRVDEASTHLRAVRDHLLADGRSGPASEVAVALGRLRLARGARRVAVKELERFLVDDPPESMDPLDRPYVPLARFYAEAGQPRRSRQLVAAFRGEVPRLYQARHRGALERTWAAIHLAEGSPRQALRAIERAAREYPVGYLSFDAWMIRLDEHPELARAYDRAGFPDSAIAVYERFLAAPAADRVELDAFELPDALFRLAELYERRGASAEAARYYLRFAQLWKDADPALQHWVGLARRRAATQARQRADPIFNARNQNARATFQRLATATRQIRRLAVLPLANLTGDERQEFFVDGMHDALVTELSRIPELTVISRQSTIKYQGTDRSVTAIARELGVDALLEGSVFRAQDSVRITVQLVRADPEGHIWARTYHGALRDAIALQGDVARMVGSAIHATAAPGSDARLSAVSVSPRAQEAYFRGLYYLERQIVSAELTRSDRLEALRTSVSHLEKAVALAPKWAAAHAKLARAYHWIASNYEDLAAEFYPKSKTAALRALELDPNEAQAHASLGFVLFNHEWDWEGAERSIQRALALDPNSHQWIYALFLMAVGRYEEAATHYQRAQERNPLSLLLKRQLAWAYSCAGRHDQAITELQELQARLGDSPDWLRAAFGQEYLMKSMYPEATAALESAVTVSDSNPWFVALLAQSYARAGRVGDAYHLVPWLEQRPGRRYTADLFDLYTALGDTGRAVALVQSAFEQRASDVLYLRCAMSYPAFRNQPQIREVVRRIGIRE